MPAFQHRATLAIAWIALCLCSFTAAQDHRRTVTTISQDDAPAIDGRLDEPIWNTAPSIENFLQTEPVEGGQPSERTVIYLLVDSDNLYIGIRCFDSSPGEILGNVFARDADLDPDDRVEIVLDTFFDRRSAYFFEIGPGGAKGDGLVEGNGDRFTPEWDGIWKGKATIDDQGWAAELAIPAKTIGLAGDHSRFGFNARRHIRRKNEIVKWVAPVRSIGLFQVANAGIIEGLEVLDPGLGIDFKPYVTARWDRNALTEESDFDADAGFDLSYRITKELKATLTVNTDFAEAEVDERVVNLTRFPTFFPEQRDFFLQDAGIFAFGGLRRSPIPFFSRRIGLSASGEKVPILTGLKVSGRIDDFNVGFLTTYMDDAVGSTPSTSVDARVLSVARVKYNVLEQSQIGVIATWGDPRSNGDNGVLGVDFQYRTNDFLGDRNLQIDAYWESSRDVPVSGETERAAWGHAFGLVFRYPNDIWSWFVGYYETGQNFRPALGFVRRGGTRHLLANFDWRPRPGGGVIRRYEFGVGTDVFWSIPQNDFESANIDLDFFGILFESGDRISASLNGDYENLFDPFTISDGITIAPGGYHFVTGRISGRTSDRRVVSGSLGLSYGSFYTGTRLRLDSRIEWRAAPGIAISSEFDVNDITLDEGSFTTRLARLRVAWDFGPDLSWSNFVQWDDVSDSLGVNSRVRWIVQPGDDVFVVVNQGLITADENDRLRFRASATEISVKVGFTFRF